MDESHSILSINSGSSSVKFFLYRIKEPLEQLLNGEIENIGTKKPKLNFNNTVEQQKNSCDIEAKDHKRHAVFTGRNATRQHNNFINI